jgi:hypothetical protein
MVDFYSRHNFLMEIMNVSKIRRSLPHLPIKGEGKDMSDHDKPRRDDRPKNNPKEDLNYRISGLEEAKNEPGMTRNDIAALDRSIAKLKLKLAEKNAPKEKEEEPV